MSPGHDDAPTIDEMIDGGPPAGIAEQRIGQLRYWLRPDVGYLYVRYAGQVGDLATADAWLAELDRCLRQYGLARVVWESRPAQGHPPDVRTRIWDWLRQAEVVSVSAIVVHSEMLRLSANLSTVGSGLRLRAFDSPEAAAQWVVAQST